MTFELASGLSSAWYIAINVLLGVDVVSAVLGLQDKVVLHDLKIKLWDFLYTLILPQNMFDIFTKLCDR